ncbi:MAG: M20 family metallopeptidase [Bacillaceae bacterium]|nr:M20 family metallopeptidase [Bacillaceae bacterium]
MPHLSLQTWLEKHNAVPFLQEAVQCNTVNPPGNERLLASRIQDVLHQHGIDSHMYVHENERVNLVARIAGKNPGKRLVFSGHLDTVPVGEVPWEVPPFSGEIIDGRLYGRGSTDMKSGLLALMYAFIYMKETDVPFNGELVFAASFGEETGSEGAAVMVEEKQIPPFDAMVIGEPTANQIFVAHKGVLWVEVSSKGKTAHGSMPDQGVNAILPINHFMNGLQEIRFTYQKHPLLTDPTMSVTTIKGGMKTNVIPDQCTLTLDIRTLPDQKHDQILAQLQEVADRVMTHNPSASLEIKPILNLPGIGTDPEAEIVQAACSVMNKSRDDVKGVNYFTDGSVFSRYAAGDIVILGPGIPELAHQPDEYVDIERYLEAVSIYYGMAQAYLK